DRDCSHVRDELSRLLDDRRRALPTLNEAQTEEDFIRPVLRALEWGKPNSRCTSCRQMPKQRVLRVCC
ncbi:MAG: hypothetical protein KGZ25_02235, partial [Planctomycetes bacterium]|nr:hypothetical protein [Planctomycetota bacterium]